MSPSFQYWDVTHVTVSASEATVSSNLSGSYQSAGYTHLKTESKKERIARIAKERMFASWKWHNQVTMSVIEVKRFLKPKYVNRIYK